MNELRYDLSYLSNPEVFALGRLPAVSDHEVFRNAEEALAGQSSLRRSLNGRWQFHYAETPEGRPVGFESDAAMTAEWGEIQVPGHIQLQGYGTPHYVNVQYPWDGHEAIRAPQIPQRYNPVGSYVRTFRVPEAWRGLRTELVLGGVESAFFVWLNGKLLGYSEDSFTPARFDLTDALCEGENRLAVEVYRFCTGSYMEDQDFWRFSGIFRDVELRAVPQAHVEDVFVHAVPEGDYSAELSLRLPDASVRLTAELTAPDGKTVDRFELPAEAKTSFARRIDQPLLWSAEQPHLYRLRLTLAGASGEVIEVAQTELGFRRFEIKDGLMLLNGKRILFRGVDRHEFGSRAGRVLSEADMLWDIRTIKRHNINAVRTSHYPNNSLWYKLCDRYGVYLIDEANLETHGSWSIGSRECGDFAVPYDREDWREACVDRARSMLERDKNHPSVLLWSCGNESFGGKDIFEMSQFFRQRDPSRAVHYEGVCHDRRYNATSDVESRMYPPALEIAKYLDEHHDKPFINCEYTHAMGNSCGGMSKYLELEDRYPQFQGGFIWDFIDQAIETTAPNGKRRLAYGGDYDDQPTDRNFCTNGLIFADRKCSPKMQEVKYLYQNIRVLPDEKGVTLDNRSLFDDASGLYLRWTLQKDGEAVRTGRVDDIRTPAGEKRRFELALGDMDQPGEYALLCELCLKKSCDWAEQGYALMHGQKVLKTVANAPEAQTVDYHINAGDYNIGANGKDYEAIFSFKEGGPVLYRREGQQPVLTYAPSLSLYRAPSDNDLGNAFARESAVWQALSAYAGTKVQEIGTQDRLSIVYRYLLPILTDAKLEARYELLPGGGLRVSLDFGGVENQSDLPAFGIAFRLPKRLSHVRYYGFGPEENYSDRREGAYLAVHETTVQQNLTPYILPQFCGNRVGVRWMELTDEAGRGLRVRMEDTPLEVSVLPHSQAELMSALHQDELAAPTYTWLDVAMARMGAGGDDSW
ncbi:MAG: glycoside hydrolase family 2 TIM barrel-domain containing protein, partial [Eubacteriales bacterium]|nr:glycoside hydrolase family 2 TIM barrel-domain containing protein [Eubacteriales bacterium]